MGGESESPDTRKVNFHIAQQPVGDALTEFGEQSGLAIGIPADLGRNVKAPPVEGRLTPAEALRRILAPAGLVAEYIDSKTVAIRTATQASNDTARERAHTQETQNPALAPAPSAETSEEIRTAAIENAFTTDSSVASKTKLEEVLVTGTQIRGATPAGGELTIVSRSDIDRSGYSTLPGVVSSLVQNFSGGPNEITSVIQPGAIAGNNSYASSVNLRGLGAGATLVLVNGHRLAPSGVGSFVDISAIPLSLVDHIEILPDGASATYGSDAVGGVFNIILKKKYNGANTALRYGVAQGGKAPEKLFSQSLGKDWTGGSVLVGYEFYRRGSMSASDRLSTANSDLTAIGGSNFSTNTSNPGNITNIGTSSVRLAVPRGQNGTALTDASFVNGINYQNRWQATNILPRETRNSALASLSQDIGGRLHLFLDGMYSRRIDTELDTYPGQTIVVPQSNAYRQLSGLFTGRGNIRMNYNLTDDLGAQRVDSDNRTYSASAGGSLDFGKTWQVEIFGLYAKQENTLLSAEPDSAALSAALASSNLATAFNPFADGSNTASAVLAGLRGSAYADQTTDVRSLNIKADGTLFELPAGPVKLAIGAEERRERYNLLAFTTSASSLVTPGQGLAPGERRVHAGFAEANIPVISSETSLPVAQQLYLSISGRYDDYSDFGSTSNPRLGFRWEPISGLELMGSYGRSFEAPLLFDLGSPSYAQQFSIPASIDPLATGGSTTTLLTSGGNKELQPETARTWNIGFEVTPITVPGLRASVTYFNVRFSNEIGTVTNTAQVFQNPAAFGTTLIRNPTAAEIASRIASVTQTFGAINAAAIEALLELRYQNLSAVHEDGIDLQTAYDASAKVGQLHLTLNATYIFGYNEQFAAGAPILRDLDTLGNPVHLRLRGGVSLTHGAFAGTSFVNFTTGYKNTVSIPSQDIESWTTVDAQVSYNTDAVGRRGWWSGSKLVFSVTNIFGKAPPFANNSTGIGFDPANANALGRVMSLEIEHRW